jgi:hypothetical protein
VGSDNKKNDAKNFRLKPISISRVLKEIGMVGDGDYIHGTHLVPVTKNCFVGTPGDAGCKNK